MIPRFSLWRKLPCFLTYGLCLIYLPRKSNGSKCWAVSIANTFMI